MNIKKHFTFSNLITLIVIFIFIYIQAPRVWNNYQTENITIKPFESFNYSSNKTITFPTSKKSILIFWASWCAPCKLEMLRFDNAIKDKELDESAIYAINPYESDMVINKFKNKYKFNFIRTSQQLVSKLAISATPTIVYLDKNKVTYVTSGVSPLGIFKARWFLRD